MPLNTTVRPGEARSLANAVRQFGTAILGGGATRADARSQEELRLARVANLDAETAIDQQRLAGIDRLRGVPSGTLHADAAGQQAMIDAALATGAKIPIADTLRALAARQGLQDFDAGNFERANAGVSFAAGDPLERFKAQAGGGTLNVSTGAQDQSSPLAQAGIASTQAQEAQRLAAAGANQALTTQRETLLQPTVELTQARTQAALRGRAGLSVTTPDGTTVQLGGNPNFKVPAGFRVRDPNNPGLGVEPIPGGNKDILTPEAAAKTQMLQTSMQSLDQLKGMIFPNGQLDRGLLATMTANAPFTEGRTARALLLDMVEAKLRAESGAAVPDTEVARGLARFAPSVLDSPETVHLRLQLMEEFLSGAFDKIDPTGRFSVEGTLDSVPELGDQTAPLPEQAPIQGQPLPPAATGQTFQSQEFGTVTMEDIEFTARANGMTIEQAMREFGVAP